MSASRSVRHGNVLRIALVYETFGTYAPEAGAPSDADAEYEPMSTIEVLEDALRVLGHEPLRIGAPGVLLEHIGRGTLPAVDAALDVAEGRGSRNREAWAPVLLEMAGVPCLGSDALTLSTTLDKLWASRMAAAAGLRVPAHVAFGSADAALEAPLPADFPLFVKPRWEGTAKGIRATSKVHTREALAVEVERVVREYAQPALVEAFVPGAEYTVTVVGHDPPRVLPVVQRALDRATGIGLHAVEGDAGDAPASEAWVPGVLTPELEARLAGLGLAAFALFECLDFARADFRLDESGDPVFLEINPLPTFAVDGTFGILAEIEGRPLPDLLAEVLHGGLVRLGLAAAPADPPDAAEPRPPGRRHP